METDQSSGIHRVNAHKGIQYIYLVSVRPTMNMHMHAPTPTNTLRSLSSQCFQRLTAFESAQLICFHIG